MTRLVGVRLGRGVGAACALLVGLSGVAAAQSSVALATRASAGRIPAALSRSGAVARGSAVDSLKAFRADGVSPDSGPEPVLVELQIGRAASRTVSAYRVGTEALVPVTALLDLGEAGYRLSLDGRLEATLNPGGRRLVIDVRSDTMSLGERRMGIAPAYRFFKDNELYVGAARLGELLESRMIASWEDLTVTLVDAERLPVGQRLRREAARQAFLQRARGFQAERSFGLERPRWDGLVLDYSFLATGEQPLGGGGYSVDLGADAFGGSLELGVQSVGATGDGHARGQGSWTGVWREGRWVKQLRLGDVFTTGPRVRSERGLFVSNAPYIRPSLLGATRYDGRLDPGWTIEAYRGAQLVALDSTDNQGRFGVDLPVSYGQNPVDFVAYGPLGEVRQFNRTYRVLSEILPARQFEYGLSAGQCNTPTCSATGNLDVRYGATDRLTLRAGVEQFWRDGAANRTYPYAAMVFNPTNAWAVTLEGVGGASATAGVQFEPSLNLQVAADYTAYARDDSPVLQSAGLRSAWTMSGFVRPMPSSGFFYLEGQVSHADRETGGSTNARLGASVQAKDVRLVPFLRVQRDALVGAAPSTQPYAGVDAFLLPRPALGPVLGSVWMRAHAEQQLNGGLLTAQVVAARPLWSGVRLEVGVGKQQGVPGATFTFMLSSYLPVVRTLTLVSAPTAGPTSASQYVQGSVLWNRSDGRLTYAPGPSLERAGLAGRVFRDENGNGQWDAGEAAVAGVRVIAGSVAAVSDSTGAFRIWDLVPFEPTLVMVDSLSIDSPLVVPAFGSASVVLGPNRFRMLDIPLVRAGVVEGRVVRMTPQGPQPLGGVTLLLTERRTGERRSLVTFSDGDFYVLGIKPGDYDVTVDPRVLERLGVAAAPLRLRLAPTGTGGDASGLEIVLTPKP
jgi:hypothetical protein